MEADNTDEVVRSNEIVRENPFRERTLGLTSQLGDFPEINMKWAQGIWESEINASNYKEMRWLFSNIVTNLYCKAKPHLKSLYEVTPTLDLPLPGEMATPDLHYIIDDRTIGVYEFKISLVSINNKQLDRYQREAYQKYKRTNTVVNFEYIIADERFPGRHGLGYKDAQHFHQMRRGLMSYAHNDRTLSTILETVAERIMPSQSDLSYHIPPAWLKNKGSHNINLVNTSFVSSDTYVRGFFKYMNKLESFMDKNFLECKDFLGYWKHFIPKLPTKFGDMSSRKQEETKRNLGRFYNFNHPWEKKNGYGRANYLILPPIHKSLSKDVTENDFLAYISSVDSLSTSLHLILDGLKLQLSNPSLISKLRELNSDIAYTKSSDLTDQDKHKLCEKYRIRVPVSKKGHISMKKIRTALATIGKEERMKYNSKDMGFKFSSHGNIQLRDTDKTRPLLQLCGVNTKTQRKYKATNVDLNTLPQSTDQYHGKINLFDIFLQRDPYVPTYQTDNLYGNQFDLNDVSRVYFTESLTSYNRIRTSPMAWFLNMYSSFYRGYIAEMSNFSTKNAKTNELRFFKHPQLPIWHLAGVPPNDQTTGPIICISLHDEYIKEPFYLPALYEAQIPNSPKILRISKPFRLALDFFAHSESYEWSFYGTELFLSEFGSTMLNTTMENLWLPSSRNITEFLDLTYITLKNIKSYGTFGRGDALKKLAITKSNDVRVIQWLCNFEARWTNLNTRAVGKIDVGTGKDPIYGIEITTVSLLHNLAYMKQIQPKLDGLDKRKVLAGFYKDELSYQTAWINSPFHPNVTDPNKSMSSDEFYLKLWKEDGNWADIAYSPDICYGVTKELFDNQLLIKPYLVNRGFPYLSALEGVKTTKVLIAHPNEESTSDTQDFDRPGLEKGSYKGLHSVNLNEATHYSSLKFKLEVESNTSMYKQLFQETMPYVSKFTFGDTDPNLLEVSWHQMFSYPPNSVLIMKLKDQQGFPKRAFFIQLESMRNMNRMMDESFHDMLEGNPLDMLRIPGSEKFIHLQHLMSLMNYDPNTFKLILSEDQAKFGDTYPMEALGQQARASYFCGEGPAIKVVNHDLWLIEHDNTLFLSSERTIISLHRRASGKTSIVSESRVFDPKTYKFKLFEDVDEGFDLIRLGSKINFVYTEDNGRQTWLTLYHPETEEEITDFELDERGYFGFYETEFLMAVDRALTDRVILMPHETANLYQQIQRSQKEGKTLVDADMVKTVTEYVESFGSFLSNNMGLLNLQDDLLSQVTQNPYIIKRVGFTLGVLNTRGTLLSVCHTTMAMKIMSYAGLENCFRGCTHSDDSIKYTDFRSVDVEELKSSKGRLTELCDLILAGYTLQPIDDFTRFQLIAPSGKVESFVSNTLVFKLMLAASVISPRFVGQRPSLLKYSFGYTGEVLQTLHEGGEVTEPSIRFITPLFNNLANESYSRDLSTVISRTRPIIESFPSSRLISSCYIGLSLMMAERFGIPISHVDPHLPLEWGGMYFAVPGMFYAQGVNSNEVRLQFLKSADPYVDRVLQWSMNIPEIWKLRSREIDEIVRNVMDAKGFGSQTVMDVDDELDHTNEMPIIEYKKQFLIRFSKTAKASKALGKMLNKFWPTVRESFINKYPNYKDLSVESKDAVQQMREAYYYFQEEYLLRRNTFNLRVLRFFNKYTSRSYLEKYMKVPSGVKIAARVGYWNRQIPNQLLDRYQSNTSPIVTIKEMWEQIHNLATSGKDLPEAVNACGQLVSHILHPLTSEVRGITIKNWRTQASLLQYHHYPLRYKQVDQSVGPVTFSKDVPLLIGLLISNTDDSINDPIQIIRGGYRAKRFIDSEELYKFRDLLNVSGFNNKAFLMKHHRFLIKLLTNKVYKPIAKLNESTPLGFSLTLGNSPILPMSAKVHEGLTEVQLRSFEIDQPTLYNVQTRLLLLAAFNGIYVPPNCRLTAPGVNDVLIPLTNIVESAQRDKNRLLMDRVLVNYAARDPNKLDFYSYRVVNRYGVHKHNFGIRMSGMKMSIVYTLKSARLSDGYDSLFVTTNNKRSGIVKLLFYMIMYYLVPHKIRLESIEDVSKPSRDQKYKGDFLVYGDEVNFDGSQEFKPALREIFFEEFMLMPDEDEMGEVKDTKTRGEWINGIYIIEYDKPLDFKTPMGRIFSRQTYIICPYRVKSDPSGGKLVDPRGEVLLVDNRPNYIPLQAHTYTDGFKRVIPISDTLIKTVNTLISLCKREYSLFPMDSLSSENPVEVICQLRKLELLTLMPISVLLLHGLRRDAYTIVGREQQDSVSSFLNPLIPLVIKPTFQDGYDMVTPIQWVLSLTDDDQARQTYLDWIEQTTFVTRGILLNPESRFARVLYEKDYRSRFSVSGGTPNNYIEVISVSDDNLYSLIKDITPYVYSRKAFSSVPLWGHGLIDKVFGENLRQFNSDAINSFAGLLLNV